ncbi:hypothetical protein VC83_01243 [Pseudogymnoascus destructans]|uniref:Uncharacterized protein n=2 Tax=Pseudogymnoascus destructans TaxID=655981 RepID=L8G6J5_PSED2|nr:uncharacterized protein VC83_01243 [Pseudogymnoascus destructans]ELR08469.1 hypothetical protein GMDG_00533 [Pseudogymnoascus destructans 20631-21]OAF62774.1 hypothetical protein VC83_01243 [Pseudogymnoascus destructans]
MDHQSVPPPLPNFEIIETAFTSLGTEIPKLRNIEAARQSQQILDGIAQIARDVNTLRNEVSTLRNEVSTLRNEVSTLKNEVAGLGNRFTALENRFTAQENATIRLQNAQRQLSFPTAPLLPLRDPQTGIPIPNCPNTIDHINRLSAVEASRILQILEVRVPRALQDRREAVRHQFI